MRGVRAIGAFQSLTDDYLADVMNDPEVHRLFTARFDADLPMPARDRNPQGVTVVSAAGPLSQAMNEVLLAAARCPPVAIRTLREIADLAAVELVYKRRETAPAL